MHQLLIEAVKMMTGLPHCASTATIALPRVVDGVAPERRKMGKLSLSSLLQDHCGALFSNHHNSSIDVAGNHGGHN
jgi:hypothetical protein